MSAKTGIEWTDRTWSPVRGCSVVSPGCVNCYAMKQAHRFSGEGKPYFGLTKQTKAGPQWTGQVRTVDTALGEPQRWKQPQRVFVNSMSDLFHEGVPDQFIAEVWRTMHTIRRHTYQILTKRADRMAELVPRLVETFGVLPNVWLLVSAEDQPRADERIPKLLATPAAVRGVSLEPLLGPVRLHESMFRCCRNEKCDESVFALSWIIVGGESGHRARPCEVAWIRSIVHQCRAANISCFVKQLGADPRDAAAERDDMCARESWPAGWMPTIAGRRVWRPDLVDRKGGDPAEWPDDLRVRQYPGAIG